MHLRSGAGDTSTVPNGSPSVADTPESARISVAAAASSIFPTTASSHGSAPTARTASTCLASVAASWPRRGS
ncbi:MAG: hypothetical protein ABS35_02795 [Kaistia sp. SCN 65-12]|nr:MAG: hypothetical protein ABS35_02795 [Kaistia sp. SCN 65-12]